MPSRITYAFTRTFLITVARSSAAAVSRAITSWT
ncbi:hypothetical protein BJ971_003210 [Actinoplanes digitatis]|uniref:Uncharacterized protein n=1 Tax=Actinoplanes digitatis TaxID=1868 RepID=A0A7W7HXM2_9ACTN|nr:hypothetical protein [Actinoplanes digitatis]